MSGSNNCAEKGEPGDGDSVRFLNQILVWPLRLCVPEHARNSGSWMAILDRVLREKKLGAAAWEPVNSVKPRGERVEGSYSEFVYFHPFVQRFLYAANTGDQDGPTFFAHYARRDVHRVRVHLKYKNESQDDGHKIEEELDVTLQVGRLQLYVFDVGLVFLVMDLRHDGPLPLYQVQELSNRIRRVYPPYWDDDGRPGHCPDKVIFMGEGDEVVGESNFFDKDTFVNHMLKYKIPPVAAHWEAIMAPLTFRKDADAKAFQLVQVRDDRIPLMNFLAVDAPHSLTRPDFVRLAFVDKHGPSNALPCSDTMLESFETDHCYDRFWEYPRQGKYISGDDVDDRERDGAGASAGENRGWLASRIMICDYAFTMVGPVADKEFYFNAQSGALNHFRNHYLQMVIIAYLHRDALLVFSDQLAGAADKFRDNESTTERGRFQKRIQHIQADLLRFTQRYWFSEISNQLQAKELFSMLTRHLGTETLYDKVFNEALHINQYLENEHAREQARLTLLLTNIATYGVVFAILLSLTTSDFFLWDWVKSTWKDGAWTVKASLIIAYAIMGLWLPMYVGAKFFDRIIEWTGKCSGRCVALFAGAIAVLLLFGASG